MYNFPLIISQFAIQGSPEKITPHGSGHIHDTFRVTNADSKCPNYLLQRINHHIFKNISALSNNILLVTNHLRNKLETIPGAAPEKAVLTVISTKNQQGFFKDDQGNFWRMYLYLENTRSYDMVKTVQQAYEGGKAFGKFQALLSDLDIYLLHETIPKFHHLGNRGKLFQDAIMCNPKDRASSVTAEIAFVKDRMETMSVIERWGNQGKLPLRTTHNDTKFNNVLLDSNDHAQCIIDLDTVMPGYMAYDFGDAIRTIVNKAPEDEKDLEKINVDLDLFEAFTKGFLEKTHGFITQKEVLSLTHGVLLLPFIMGLRFLTDYIDGDHYYKINFPQHNLQRARAQFKLVEKLEEKFDLLQGTIQKYSLIDSEK